MKVYTHALLFNLTWTYIIASVTAGRPVFNAPAVSTSTSSITSQRSSSAPAISTATSLSVGRGRPVFNAPAKATTTSSVWTSTSTSALATSFAATLQGKVLYGYQAWFGTIDRYTHWSFKSGPPNNSSSQFDTFPDTSQYPTECLWDSDFHYANGSALKLYDAACEGVIATHFRWMNEQNIDGVIVQRFVVNIVHPAFTTILRYVKKYAEMYNKVFMVEYDLSDLSDQQVANLTATMQEDWINIIQPLTTSKSYLHEGGKPVIMVFGEGIRTNISPAQCMTLNSQLKNLGTYLVLATNWPWYEAYSANPTDTYASVYSQGDTISPWTVGSYSAGSGYPVEYMKRKAAQDPILKANKQKYAPVIWPGSSWHNLQYNGKTPPNNYAYNQFPRQSGAFLQQQIVQTLADNSTYFVFIAMFDEVNEGTNNMPFLKKADLPVDGTFVASDQEGGPSDPMYYLTQGGIMSQKLKSLRGI